MATAFYLAIVERAGEGYSVFFPDLPGCTSAGASIQEAARNAEEALAAHLVLSAEYGDDIPAPSDPEKIERDPDVEEAARMLVRVELPGRAQRLNITLDEGLVAAIDQAAPNRSAFLAAAARAALAAGISVSARKLRHSIARDPNIGQIKSVKRPRRRARAKPSA